MYSDYISLIGNIVKGHAHKPKRRKYTFSYDDNRIDDSDKDEFNEDEI